jgi:hypothetical protein
MKNLPLSTLCLILLAAPVLTSVPARAQDAAAPAKYDFGDFSSATLTGKAWKAFESKNFAAVAVYTAKCQEMFGAKALEMQKSLSAPAPKDSANTYWALNDVGTCYYILGKSLEEQGKKKEAITPYKFLSENLAFAQCYDTKGWFWKPADAAKERVKALEFDAL